MSRADFEKWFKREGCKAPFDLFATWQAAESHTALRCAELCHAEQNKGAVFGKGNYASAYDARDAIRAAYPDAFKEGE